MNKIHVVEFTSGTTAKTITGLFQWNFGQILQIKGLDLPSAVEVHFALRRSGEAIRRIGVTKDGVTEVEIPDVLFKTMMTSDYDIYAYVYVSDEEYGSTTHEIVLKVKSRPMPDDVSDNFEKIMEAVKAIADGKVDKEQGVENNGKFLGVVDGYVALMDAPSDDTANAVQYVTQELTEEQQEQARANIGAANVTYDTETKTLNICLGGGTTNGLIEQIEDYVIENEIEKIVIDGVEVNLSRYAKKEETDRLSANKADKTALSQEKAERQAEIAVERERINNLAKLEPGSTTGDAELIDARVDKDGNTYDNVGEHIRQVSSRLSEEIVEHSELLCDYPYKFVNSVTTGKPIEGSAEIEDNIYYFCSDNMYIGSENTLSVEFINTTGKDLYIVIDRCDSNGLVNKIGLTFTVLNGDTWNYVFKDKYDYVKFHGRTTDMKSVENILGVIKTGFKIIIKNYEQKILEDYKGISHSNVIERLMSDEAILSSVENKISNMSILNVLDIGCKNDGVTNNSPILNQILDTKENITLYFPKGDYKINNTIIMYNSNLLLDNGARIFTENELPYLVSVNPYTEETGKYKYGVSIKNFIKGGCFDGCDRAYNIIGLEHYTNFTIDDVKIYNFRYRGIECATDRNKQSTTISHGGLMVSHCLIRNWTDTGELSGTIGIDNANAADNKFFDNTLVNCQIGIDTNYAIISRIHHWISFANILVDSVFVRNKNSYTTISDCCIDTVCCAVQSIDNQTRIINSTMFFNPLFVDENTFACFAKHGVSSGYVYAINCLFYMPTGRAKVSDYDTSNFPDKYLMCRFVPEENFDFSNYEPLL